jgi:hypothetical protein
MNIILYQTAVHACLARARLPALCFRVRIEYHLERAPSHLVCLKIISIAYGIPLSVGKTATSVNDSPPTTIDQVLHTAN